MADERRSGGAGAPRVERLALEFDRFCGEVERRVAARAWAHNRQLQRTSASMLANVGEAFDEASPGEQWRFFDYARRAAGEAERLLEAIRLRGGVTEEEFAHAMRLLRDIKMDLRRLMAWAERRER